MLFEPLGTWRRCAAVLAGTVLLIFLWETALAIGWVTPFLLPHIHEIVHTLGGLLVQGYFWVDLGSTILTWFLGVVIGFLCGGLLGLLLGLNRYIWAATEPWVEFLRSLPSVVLVPLISLFLGVGFTSRLVCASVVVFVLMISTAALAVRTARNSHLRLAQAWRASRQQTIFYFYLPAVATDMAVALKAAIPIALIVTVAADMVIATESGLGRIILDSLATFDIARMYATVFVVGVLGYGAALGSSWLERRVVHWSGS